MARKNNKSEKERAKNREAAAERRSRGKGERAETMGRAIRKIVIEDNSQFWEKYTFVVSPFFLLKLQLCICVKRLWQVIKAKSEICEAKPNTYFNKWLNQTRGINRSQLHRRYDNNLHVPEENHSDSFSAFRFIFTKMKSVFFVCQQTNKRWASSQNKVSVRITGSTYFGDKRDKRKWCKFTTCMGWGGPAALLSEPKCNEAKKQIQTNFALDQKFKKPLFWRPVTGG